MPWDFLDLPIMKKIWTNSEKLVPVDDQNDANGAGAILPSVETVKNKTYLHFAVTSFVYLCKLRSSKTSGSN